VRNSNYFVGNSQPFFGFSQNSLRIVSHHTRIPAVGRLGEDGENLREPTEKSARDGKPWRRTHRGRDEEMKTKRASRRTVRLRELREERGFSQGSLAEESGVGRSTIAALEAGERGAHPTTVHALARALGVTVLDLYGSHITPLPMQDQQTQTAHSYARLRQSLRDAFPGVENDVHLECITEQFMVELGWLQERIFPLDLTPPRTPLSAHDLLELADDFYRFRTELWAWPME
jgi:transcriptional regulator with XRE-family HTH domain